MHHEDKIFFSFLKKEVAAMMMRSYPGIDPEISNWKGQSITDFQEDLRIKVNGQLSEKWFYIHMKNDNVSLPRIDVLNLLCQYAGYANWQDFRFRMTDRLPSGGRQGKSETRLRLIILAVMVLVVLLFIIIKMIITKDYKFTFVDSDSGEYIHGENLRVELLSSNESPVRVVPDENGRFTIKTKQNRINMVVKAPYYFTDSIERSLRAFRQTERINLKPDYYALMIRHFSHSEVSTRDKRREQLDKLISENAIIYQFPENIPGSAMAIYNKWEFIDKITMPASGLRNLEIVDCRYLNGKIAILRFRTKDESE